jgi:phosphatidylserine decarboxylase
MRSILVKDGYPLIFGLLAVLGGAGIVFQVAGFPRTSWVLYVLAVILTAFMVYFFRDPERKAPHAEHEIVAGADGVIRAVETIREDKHLNAETIRISTFLSPFNVHVNRAPMGGVVKHLSYTPGRHLLTLQNAASEYNEHSSILIENGKTRCLVKQIVGPIVRRVVYWLSMEQSLAKGERIGMMKFGSRLDMYFLKSDVQVCVKKGDKVKAGLTVVATLKKEK